MKPTLFSGVQMAISMSDLVFPVIPIILFFLVVVFFCGRTDNIHFAEFMELDVRSNNINTLAAFQGNVRGGRAVIVYPHQRTAASNLPRGHKGYFSAFDLVREFICHDGRVDDLRGPGRRSELRQLLVSPVPYWVTYPELVKLCGGKPVIISTKPENKYKITANELKNAITPKTKILVLCSPSNPSGAVYDKSELVAIAEVLKGTDIVVFADEIYEKIIFNKEFVAIASISEDMFKRTVTINGLSKCAAMPGWRFGYAATANDELAKAMKKLQSQSTSNISSIVQAGAVPVLLGEADSYIADMKKEFQRRRDYAVDAINAIDGLSVVKPDGAFYLFVNCSKIENDSMKFCMSLLEDGLVATVPGVGFGMDGHFRVSYACSMDDLKKGIDRIAKFVKNYK